MVFNFRAHEISRGARKLTRTPMLIKKIKINAIQILFRQKNIASQVAYNIYDSSRLKPSPLFSLPFPSIFVVSIAGLALTNT